VGPEGEITIAKLDIAALLALVAALAVFVMVGEPAAGYQRPRCRRGPSWPW
jgi:hypothetical protein